MFALSTILRPASIDCSVDSIIQLILHKLPMLTIVVLPTMLPCLKHGFSIDNSVVCSSSIFRSCCVQAHCSLYQPLLAHSPFDHPVHLWLLCCAVTKYCCVQARLAELLLPEVVRHLVVAKCSSEEVRLGGGLHWFTYSWGQLTV